MSQCGKLSFVALACVLVASISSGQQVGDVSNRIIRGSVAKPGEFPFMANTKVFVDGRWQTLCGGSIIGKRHILTAAHCVEKFQPNKIRVMLGCHLLSKCFDAYKVKKIIVHSKYERPSNDIAILKLDRPIEFNQVVGLGSIGKISLNKKMLEDEKWGNLTVIGWGATESARKSDVLKKADVRANSFEVCQKTFAIFANEMCAVGDNEGACKGDSGGPLFKTLDDGTRLQVGIVRGGKECKQGGIYTRVASHYKWIMKHARE